jgi:tryptophanyl-tRNA synthetase
MYPVLMAADILMFNAAQECPWGATRSSTSRWRATWQPASTTCTATHFTVLPEAAIEADVATLPGLDGRKMSKSYDNTIPLCLRRREQLRKLIMGIVTDSRAPGEPKDTEGSALFQLYQAFASPRRVHCFSPKPTLTASAWGDAKQQLFERIDRDIAPMREQYEAMVNNPQQVEAILRRGAEKARALSAPFMAELRQAVGLRHLSHQTGAATSEVIRITPPSFKQYREADGKFYFKLVAAGGEVLLQSPGFENPREPGVLIAQLKTRQTEAMQQVAAWWAPQVNADDTLASFTQG